MIFKRYTQFSEMKPYRDAWQSLTLNGVSPVPFLTYDYLEAWWQTRGGGEWPSESELALIAAFEDQRLMGVAPLFSARNGEGKPALMFVGSIEVSDFLDVIVEPENHQAFLAGLIDFLESDPSLPHWEQLDLYNLLDDSPTRPVLSALAENRGWTAIQEQLQPSPYVNLPQDFDAYLMMIDKKQRHEIRRKLRNVADSLAESDFVIVRHAEEVQPAMAAFIAMMAQDPNKKDFLTEPMREHLHKTAQLAFENGWLHLAFLTFDGQKAAGNFSFLYQNRLWLYNSGWVWDYREYSPGWVLLAELIRWSTEHGVEALDFMRGDETYKYKFGGVDRHVLRLTIER